MKRPQPDVKDLLQARFLSDVATVRKFVRYWGTDTVNGVEVLKSRQYYYPVSLRAENFEKLFKFLGQYDTLANINKKDYDGIDKAWIYLNKGRAANFQAIVEEHNLKGFIADNLNRLWWDYGDGDIPEDLTLTTTIIIESLIDSSGTTTDLLGTNWPEEVLVSAIANNYDTLYRSCRITQQGVGVIHKGSIIDEVTKVETPDNDDLSPNDPWLKVLATTALKSNGPPCTIKRVRIGLGKDLSNHLYNTYTVTLEIPYFLFSENSSFIDDIEDAVASEYTSQDIATLAVSNAAYVKNNIVTMSSADLETDPTLITRPYILWEDFTASAVQNTNLWIGKQLRADALLHPRDFGLTFRKMNNYVLPLIDTDYRKEKISGWSIVIAVIIVIIIIIVTIINQVAGSMLAKVFFGVMYGVVWASLALSVLSLIASSAGWTDFAMACAYVNKRMEPLVQIASVILILTATFQTLAEQGAAGVAGTPAVGGATTAEGGAIAAEGVTTGVATAEGGTVVGGVAAESGTLAVEGAAGGLTLDTVLTGLKELTLESFADIVKDQIVNQFKSVITGATDFFTGTLSKESIKFAQYLIKAYTYPQQLKLEELQSRNKDLQAENEELVKEMIDQNDPLARYMQTYTKVLATDQSVYASRYDLPYESSQTLMHTGNVQQTVVQAVRRADYKTDPVNAAVFANILIM